MGTRAHTLLRAAALAVLVVEAALPRSGSSPVTSSAHASVASVVSAATASAVVAER